MNTDNLVSQALQQPVHLISYHLTCRLHRLYPDREILQGGDPSFNVEEYARAGLCRLWERADPYRQRLTYWRGPEAPVLHRAVQTWFEVEWEGHRLDVLVMHWNDGMGPPYHYFILAHTADLCERFLNAVCGWNTTVWPEEMLVFDGGGWHKDPDLLASIRGVTLDDLVLRGSLKEDIHADLASFFSNRAMYDRYGVPWKRGVLFVGPPGNGKTHAIKAFINALGQTCLYVRSFHGGGPDEFSIRAVFDRARISAPCVLVLEDLDSLVTDSNRSYFLNELDGFAGNTGILTLASSNHPDRLDPAIVDRPSRFDRKYAFDLPALEERQRYIRRWNASLQPELQLPDGALSEIAERTDGFSFAYLKELFLSAMMRWIAAPRPGAMEAVMSDQVGLLRDQMTSALALLAANPAASGGPPLHVGPWRGPHHPGMHHPGMHGDQEYPM